MACRVNNSIKRTTTTHLSLTKSSGGGGAVIAGGRTSPSGNGNPNGNNNLHQQNSQNNNKSASSGVNQAHLLNSHRAGNCISKSAEDISENHTPSLNIQSESESTNSFDDIMAGDIRLVDGKKPRKLWTLRDRSDMSVHLLKANLAEDGCEEAQLAVAKKLLQEDSNDTSLLDTSQRENSRLAIYWLIKSSEQGNDEATRLLQECLSSGRGITGQNILDVKTCISTPKNEKLTFKAARLLYLKLNNGEEFITTTQLLARIHEVKRNVEVDVAEGESAKTSTESSFNENPSEEEIISGSGMGRKTIEDEPFQNVRLNETFIYTHGRISCDGVNANSSVTHQEGNYRNGSLQKELLNYEMLLKQEGVKLTLEDLLKNAGSFNSGSSPNPPIDSSKKELGRHNWKFLCQLNTFVGQLLILAAISGVISLKNCCLLGSTFVSIWASYNLLIWDRRHSNFQDWSKAFRNVLEEFSWSDEKAENKFTWKFLLPYLSSLIVSLVVINFCEGLNPLKVITGCLVIFTLFRGVMKSLPSWRVIGTFVLASLPNVTWNALNSIDKLFESNLTKKLEGLIDDFVKPFEGYFASTDKYTIVLTVQLIILTSLLWTKRNILLQGTLPEVVFAVWLIKVSQISLQLTTVTFCICIGISSLIVFAFLVCESNMNSWKVLTFSVGIIIVGLSCLIALYFTIEGGSLQNILSFDAEKYSAKSFDFNTLNHIEWDEYDMNCHRRAWKVVSPAETQIKCFLKYGGMTPVAVRWNGRISIVKIKEMEQPRGQNSIEDVLFDISVNILTSEGSESPTSWQSFLPGSSETGPSSPASILVSTKSLATAEVKQNLIDYMLNLRSGDKIEFYGVLNPSSAGSLKPEIVNVQSLKCVGCAIAENYAEYNLSPDTPDEKATVKSFFMGESYSSYYLTFFKSYWKSIKSYIDKNVT